MTDTAPDFALPWKVQRGKTVSIADATGMVVIPMVTELHAELIVAAVNSHEPMREALDEFDQCLDQEIIDRLDDAVGATPPLDPARLVMLLTARNKARAALASALPTTDAVGETENPRRAYDPLSREYDDEVIK